TATQRGDFTYAEGSIAFAAGETSKTFPVLTCDDSYAEGVESVTLRLTAATGATLGSPSAATLQITDNDPSDRPNNAIDDSQTFVCQHYHDFLNRDALGTNDQAGLNFWTNQIEACGNDQNCRTVKRISVSQAF